MGEELCAFVLEAHVPLPVMPFSRARHQLQRTENVLQHRQSTPSVWPCLHTGQVRRVPWHLTSGSWRLLSRCVSAISVLPCQPYLLASNPNKQS
jgi:hypothetical protein